MREGSFVEIPWSGIHVGDILKVKRNAPLPADSVFLSSFSEESDQPDTCYVQTAQLDGETNLKLKTAAFQSVSYFKGDQSCATFRGSIKCEAPNAAFDKFVGTLDLNQGGPLVPLEADNLLLRGSVLRNVDYAYAMVVYTGRETKVRVRQTTRRTKFAQVETQLNNFIRVLIILLLSLCITGTIGLVISQKAQVESQWYFGPNRRPIGANVAIEQFFTFFLLNAAFIPVSLYVSVRLARTLQILFMEWDLDLVHVDEEAYAASNGQEGSFPLKVRSMELNDELGQITHIFSDKTGTLTLNYMEWRKLMVRGIPYGLGTTQIGIDRLRRAGLDVSHLEGAMQSEKLRGKERGAQLPHVNFEDGSDSHPGRFLGSDSRDPRDGAQGSAIHHLLLNLSLNHTVIPEVVRSADGEIKGTKLSAASPDEEAFCYAAETLGYKFVSRTQEGVCLQIRHALTSLPFAQSPTPFLQPAKDHSSRLLKGVRTSLPNEKPLGSGDIPFGILSILAYTQERKCMSVVVEHPVVDCLGNAVVTGPGGASRGDIYLYTKGADSAIFPKCLTPSSPAEAAVWADSKAHLGDWGNDGLRTLVFACRKIPRAQYEAWEVKYKAACQDLSQLKLRKDKRPNLIDDLQSELEVGLELQGATANEDKLQPEVPETLALLARAGIRLWMVTGDKQETAVNIGFATKLLDTSQRQIIVTMESAGGVIQALKRLRVAAKRMRAEKKADEKSKRDEGARAGLAASGRIISWFNDNIPSFLSSTSSPAPDLPPASPKNKSVPPGHVVTNVMSLNNSERGGGAAMPEDDYNSEEDEEALALGDSSDAAMGFKGPPHGSHPADSAPMLGGAGSMINNKVIPNPAHSSRLMGGSPSSSSSSSSSSSALSGGASARPFALIIDEHCLDAALNNSKARGYLLFVAVHCDAVIACRARPDQKAQLVKLIRGGLASARTLAIGDGANDVDMIGAAHVGVGIAGVEGVQAANASDFSIGRFKFLQRLLFVHGRWNYSRMARVVLYMFWKNVVFVLTQFLFQIQTNGWSGQKWYVEYAAQAFNILFSGFAPLVMGALDRDVDAEWALRYPKLYDYGRLAAGLNLSVFMAWMSDALFSAVIIYVFTVYGYRVPDFVPGGVPGGGSTPFIFSMGTVAYSIVVVVVNLRIAAETFHHGRLFQFSVLISCLLWIPVCFVLDALKQDGMLGGMRFIFGSSAFWLTLLLTSGLLGIRMMAYKGWKRVFHPQLRHIVQEVFSLGLDQRSIIEYTDLAEMARKLGLSVQEMAYANKTARTAAEAVVVVPSGPRETGDSMSSPSNQLLLASKANHFVNTSPVKAVGSGFSSDPSEGGYSALRGDAITVGNVSRTAQHILDAALRPIVREGDADFDTPLSPAESNSAPISPEGLQNRSPVTSNIAATDRVAAVLNADFKATVQAKLDGLEAARS